ncbi:MAG TPA: ATP-dependent DNA helicase [Baekduia sp.]|nr:ATP-dependent DNA helicase [Baekduia sp.]
MSSHSGGPLAVLGGAGSGKSTALIERFCALAERGAAPETILLLTLDGAAADSARLEIEQQLAPRGFSELHVLPFHAFCARLLRDEALEAGIDPLMIPASAADRLALLLGRVDELTLRLHDFGGSPARLLGAVIARIDLLKAEGIDAKRFSTWAQELPDGDESEREREFAGLFTSHDRMLAEQGAIDHGDLVLRATRLLQDVPHVRARTSARYLHVLADDAHDASPAQLRLLTLLAAEHGDLVATFDDDQALSAPSAGAASNFEALIAAGAERLELGASRRIPRQVAAAAHAVVEPAARRIAKQLEGTDAEGEVRFWRCVNERAQAQSVAAAIERLVHDGVDPGQIGVIVRSVRREGQAVAVALNERAIAHELVGASAFFAHTEVRDVLSWLRLLVDPGDSAAVVRALSRPPIQLQPADLARCVQIARRRKLDMVSALVAATESPQLPPEARERVLGFLKLHRAAAAALDSTRPDLFVHRLIERLGVRRAQLFAAQADVVERLVSLARVGELATGYARRAPQATARDFAGWLAAIAEAGMQEDDGDGRGSGREHVVAVIGMDGARGAEFDHVFVLGLQSARMPGAREQPLDALPADLLEQSPHDDHAAEMRRMLHVAMTRARETLTLAYPARSERGALRPPSPFVEEARAAVDGEWEDREEELFGPDEAMQALFSELRDELIGTLPRTAARLGELRLDTDLDVAHGVTRYLELLKLAAIIGRPDGQPVAEALATANAAIEQAATAAQREVLHTSNLDELLQEAERDARVRANEVAARDQPSLEQFLPRRGEGLALSASDIETYRSCPLKYKFARVFRIPQEPTTYQRFGIVVHQVLERYHQTGGATVDELLGLLDAAWRRGGMGGSDEERQLHGKAVDALNRYHARTSEEDSEPLWFEKGFQFQLGPHVLRGRVDRVDRLKDGSVELIDYKTGRPKAQEQLRDDVQLSLYAIAAREAWDEISSQQAYLYVLDDEKVQVPTDQIDPQWIEETVREVGDGILSQGFEPTPSFTTCSWCDYRIACPAAER